MSEVSRRKFLIGSGVGAAGVVAASAAGGLPGIAGAAASESASHEELEAASRRPMLLHVRDARRGEVGILVGEHEVIVKDKALVAKLLRATR